MPGASTIETWSERLADAETMQELLGETASARGTLPLADAVVSE
jgi:hypothetical protein